MKIVITGKGGVGKTTVAATLARILGREGQRVLALDVDSSPNLAFSLGIPRDQATQVPPVPQGLTEWRQDAEGKAYVHLRQPVAQFIKDYGLAAPDDVCLLVMGEVLQAAVGCRCEAHAVARGVTGSMISEADAAILDMEPGLEHLGRGTAEHVDVLLIVVEPYFRALMTATRIQELALQLELPHIFAVANRVRSASEQAAVEDFCRRHHLELIASVPYDESVRAAEELGLAPIDHAPDCPAVQAIRSLAVELSARVQ